MTEFLCNEALFERVIVTEVPATQRLLWIATADLKDLHVPGTGRDYEPFLAVLARLVDRGVEVRLMHAKEPGPRFRQDFDRFPELIDSAIFERLLCPRLHTKAMIFDGARAYLGSANLTGAGLGGKHPDRRNIEAGIFTDEAGIVEPLIHSLDQLYLGEHCINCQRRDVCPDPIV